MKRGMRTLVVLGIAVLMAGVASFSVYEAIRRIPVREVEVPKAFTIVAAKGLPVGAQIAREDVKVVGWPSDSPVPGSFSSVDPVVGRGLIAPVIQNEPLTESKLAPLKSGAGLPPTIPPGMRAISVKVNDVIGVAGFVVPGTRVDVLVALTRQPDDFMARIVVSNVQVLTAGTRYDQEKAKSGEPIQTTVVTLVVTPQDAERIALAAAGGQIMLTLRNPLDQQPTETMGVRLASLMAPPAPPPVERKVQGHTMLVAAKPAAPPVPPAYVVETIRGAKRAEEVVR
jgi:pilus assembly protein CpaB